MRNPRCLLPEMVGQERESPRGYVDGKTECADQKFFPNAHQHGGDDVK